MATSRSKEKKGDAIAKAGDGSLARKPSNEALPVALCGGGVEKTMQILKANLGLAGKLTVSDLTKITIPSGGGTAWQMPNPIGGGKPKNVDAIECVIIAFKDQKAFWKESIDDSGGGTPPNCRSVDMVHGIGDPGGFCDGGTDLQPEPCPFNVFGSAKEGEAGGKACKDLRFLFILEGKSRIPKLIIVPPTSLKSMRRYFLDLAGQEIPHYAVITRLELEPDKNATGIKYSRISPSAVAELNEEEIKAAEEFCNMISPMIGNMVTQLQGKDVKSDG